MNTQKVNVPMEQSREVTNSIVKVIVIHFVLSVVCFLLYDSYFLYELNLFADNALLETVTTTGIIFSYYIVCAFFCFKNINIRVYFSAFSIFLISINYYAIFVRIFPIAVYGLASFNPIFLLSVLYADLLDLVPESIMIFVILMVISLVPSLLIFMGMFIRSVFNKYIFDHL